LAQGKAQRALVDLFVGDNDLLLFDLMLEGVVKILFRHENHEKEYEEQEIEQPFSYRFQSRNSTSIDILSFSCLWIEKDPILTKELKILSAIRSAL